jgi:hypothetical protein
VALQSRTITTAAVGAKIKHFVLAKEAGVLARPLSFTVFLLVMTGCGWQDSASLVSPSGKIKISVGRGYSPMARIEVELSNNDGIHLVYRSPGEAFFQFFDAYWSDDEKTVGVVIAGTGLWNLAFSTIDGREVSFDQVRPQMESAIRKDYRVPANVSDAIQWTYSTDAQNQFRAKHTDRH